MSMQSFETPQEVELGSVVTQIRVTAKPQDLPDGMRFVGLENIPPHEGRILGVSTASEVRSKVFRFENNDVLYGRLRPYLKKAVVVDFEGCASGEIIVLRCSQRILPRFLLMLLLSDAFAKYVNFRSKGDRPRVSFASISRFRFELPSLEAQAEICDQDTRLVQALAQLGEASLRSNEAMRSIVSKIRTDLIWSHGDKLNRAPLAELVESIDYGTSKKSFKEAMGTAVLRIPNISSDGCIDATDIKYSPLSLEEIEKYSLAAGDLLIIRSNGTLSLVGTAAKISSEHAGFSFAGYLLRMRPREGVMSDYLLQLFASPPFRRMVEGAAKSSTGINNLSAGRLAAFDVPLHPRRDQELIVKRLTRLQAAVSSLGVKMQEARSIARDLHEAVRADWLGAKEVERHDRLTVQGLEPQLIPARVAPQSTDIEATVRRRLQSRPQRNYSFSELFDDLSDDYEVARQTVFQMLASKPPRIVQIFDQETSSVLLRQPE